jgi:hypothetical protein
MNECLALAVLEWVQRVYCHFDTLALLIVEIRWARELLA